MSLDFRVDLKKQKEKGLVSKSRGRLVAPTKNSIFAAKLAKHHESRLICGERKDHLRLGRKSQRAPFNIFDFNQLPTSTGTLCQLRSLTEFPYQLQPFPFHPLLNATSTPYSRPAASWRPANINVDDNRIGYRHSYGHPFALKEI